MVLVVPVRMCKAELAAILQASVTLDLTRADHRQEALAAVKRGDMVRVLSATLGEAIYWVWDEEIAERLKRAPDYQGEVCYTLAELRELSGQSPELLRDIHQFKRAFDVTLHKTTKEGRA